MCKYFSILDCLFKCRYFAPRPRGAKGTIYRKPIILAAGAIRRYEPRIIAGAGQSSAIELQTKVREDFTITKKAPGAFPWLKAPTSAY